MRLRRQLGLDALDLLRRAALLIDVRDALLDIDARFVILGEGELRESLEQQIHRKHLERHVMLGGFRADAVALMRNFDVFALSSTHEGLCTSLIDAMAASKPAVATTVGGVPEVVVDGETGFLVAPHDPPAMAERIVQLLRDPALRTRMGAAALTRARTRFTVERMVEETVAVYARLVTWPAHRSQRYSDTDKRHASQVRAVLLLLISSERSLSALLLDRFHTSFERTEKLRAV